MNLRASLLLATALWAPRLASQDLPDLLDHYARAEAELRARELPNLAPEQRAERARLLDALRAYRERGLFGVNAEFPRERLALFVDPSGRRCAVANLLDRSGMGRLTERIAASANHAWIAELAEDPELLAWLDRSGLTLAEAARIQAPSRHRNTPPAEPPPPPPVYKGPADAGRFDGGGFGGGAKDKPYEPLAPAASGKRGGAAGAPRREAMMSLVSDDEEWTTWWAANRGEFLRPNPIRGTAPVTGTGYEVDQQRAIEEQRRVLAQALIANLAHADFMIRSAAAVALGRIAGEDAVPHLLGLLDDPSSRVRGDAILALGATGAPRAVHALLHLSTHGRLAAAKGDARGELVLPTVRPLALLALGLARRQGDARRTDPEVAHLLRTSGSNDREFVSGGALLYQSLASVPELQGFALERARDQRETTSLRCRAVEMLGPRGDAESLTTLTQVLAGSDLEVRRSAALALGELRHPLALPALQTAFELEKDPLTRGFVLLGIGRQGGADARSFLVRALESGRKTSRPWAALGLGLLARRDDDREARSAVLRALEGETNQDARSAFVIAAGIGRDEAALGRIRECFFDAKGSLVRMSAAEALAMIGGPTVHADLTSRLESDPCSVARLTIAEVLGYLGHPDDAAVLARVLTTLKDPTNRARLASALGMLGSVSALRELVTVARDETQANLVRAAAIEGAGLILTRSPGMVLQGLGRSANYRVIPTWLAGTLALSL